MSKIYNDLRDILTPYAQKINTLDENVSNFIDEKITQQYVTPQMFGAKADDTTDDSAAIQSAIDSGKAIFFPKGTYLINTSINLHGLSHFVLNAENATIHYTGYAYAFNIHALRHSVLKFDSIVSDNGGCLYFDGTVTGYWSQYNNIYFQYFSAASESDCVRAEQSGTNCWINENRWHNGRMKNGACGFRLICNTVNNNMTHWNFYNIGIEGVTTGFSFENNTNGAKAIGNILFVGCRFEQSFTTLIASTGRVRSFTFIQCSSFPYEKVVTDAEANNWMIYNSLQGRAKLVNGIWEKEGHHYALSGGLPIEIDSDLNDITSVGNYYISNNNNAKTLLNSPTNYAFRMRIESRTGGEDDTAKYQYRKQTIVDFNNKTYQRVFSSSNKGVSWTWSQWKDKLGDLQTLLNSEIDNIQTTLTTINSTLEENENQLNSFSNQILNFEQTTDQLYNIIHNTASGVPTVVSNISEMVDTLSLYILTTDENWYYYNGTSWVSGGLYGEITTDTTVSREGVAADSKAVRDTFCTKDEMKAMIATTTGEIQWQIPQGTHGTYPITVQGHQIIVNGDINISIARTIIYGEQVLVAEKSPTYANYPHIYLNPIASFVPGHKIKVKIKLISGEYELAGDSQNYIDFRNLENNTSASFLLYDEEERVIDFQPQIIIFGVRKGSYTNAVFEFSIIDVDCTDRTLSIEQKPADAAVTGERITEISSNYDILNSKVQNFHNRTLVNFLSQDEIIENSSPVSFNAVNDTYIDSLVNHFTFTQENSEAVSTLPNYHKIKTYTNSSINLENTNNSSILTYTSDWDDAVGEIASGTYDFVSNILTVDTFAVTLTGEENYVDATTAPAGFRVVVRIPKIPKDRKAGATNQFSSHLSYQNNAGDIGVNKNTNCFKVYPNSTSIYFYIEGYDTLEDTIALIKELYNAGTPLQFACKTSTIKEYQIKDISSIALEEGAYNVTNTTENAISVKYSFPLKEKIYKLSEDREDIFNSAPYYKNLIPDWQTKVQTFCNLLNDTSQHETFLFFTDPHIFGDNGIPILTDQNITRMKNYMSNVQKVYNSSPTSFIVCGGDWLHSGDTISLAVKKLGYIDGMCKSMFHNYHHVVGNHDVNFRGIDNNGRKYDSSEFEGMLSPLAVRNLWYREEQSCYYKFDGSQAKCYVLDTNTNYYLRGQKRVANDPPSNYELEQAIWFANNLKDDDPNRAIVFLHIPQDHPMVTLADQVIAAFNSHSTTIINNVTIDFSNCLGHIDFCMAGHNHNDEPKTIGGIKCIVTTWSNYGKNPTTFDLVDVNYGTRKVNCIRIGNGNDRQYDF